MGAKAERKHIPQPPLDDDAWLPISAARLRLIEHTGDAGRAMIALTDALARGRLRCMVRLQFGERKRITPAAWRFRLVLSAEADDLHVLQRLHDFVERVQGRAFYVWQPDLETGWPPGGARRLS